MAFSLIGWVANEKEMKLVDPTVEDFTLLHVILVSALKSSKHRSESGMLADERLEDIANLIGCADDNVSDVIAARIPIVLGAVLYGPLAAKPEKVKAGEYTEEEKLLALRCCHTMCFKKEGRDAIASIPRLAGGAFLTSS